MFNHCLHLSVLVVNLIYKQQSHGDYLSNGRRETMANTSTAKYPNNQPGKASKPANQGGAGNSKVVTQQPRIDGMPKAAKPGASVTMLSTQPSGTHGSK
jgi:hypothetical protein